MSGPDDAIPIRLVGDPDTAHGYRAGACNIGPAEIARRRRAGLTGLGTAAALAVAVVALGLPPVARLVIFPFLAGGLVSLEQARRRFCVGFAMAGLRNFGPLGTPESVTDAADRAADRRAAIRMTFAMASIAAVITLVFVALPID